MPLLSMHVLYSVKINRTNIRNLGKCMITIVVEQYGVGVLGVANWL